MSFGFDATSPCDAILVEDAIRQACDRFLADRQTNDVDAIRNASAAAIEAAKYFVARCNNLPESYRAGQDRVYDSVHVIIGGHVNDRFMPREGWADDYLSIAIRPFTQPEVRPDTDSAPVDAVLVEPGPDVESSWDTRDEAIAAATSALEKEGGGSIHAHQETPDDPREHVTGDDAEDCWCNPDKIEVPQPPEPSGTTGGAGGTGSISSYGFPPADTQVGDQLAEVVATTEPDQGLTDELVELINANQREGQTVQSVLEDLVEDETQSEEIRGLAEGYLRTIRDEADAANPDPGLPVTEPATSDSTEPEADPPAGTEAPEKGPGKRRGTSRR